MNKHRIYFIYMPSPSLGRSPMQNANGAGIFGRLFGLFSEDKYIDALIQKVNMTFPEWEVFRDDTEADIEKLRAQDAALLVCAPGLKYQFFTDGFDKNRIVYLSTMEYSTLNTHPVIMKIKELENA